MFGLVIWLRSLQTGTFFPKLELRGIPEYIELGVDTLTSVHRPEVVIFTFTGEEIVMKSMREIAAACEKRLNADLQRDDLRMSWSIRREALPWYSPQCLLFITKAPLRFYKRVVKRSELSIARRIAGFIRYDRAYRPYREYYHDIYSVDGEAVKVREESLDDFQVHGGKVINNTGFRLP